MKSVILSFLMIAGVNAFAVGSGVGAITCEPTHEALIKRPSRMQTLDASIRVGLKGFEDICHEVGRRDIITRWLDLNIVSTELDLTSAELSVEVEGWRRGVKVESRTVLAKNVSLGHATVRLHSGLAVTGLALIVADDIYDEAVVRVFVGEMQIAEINYVR